MLDVADTSLEMENPSIARVHCARCGAELGRLQVRAPAVGEDPHVWEEEVRGEREVLAAEHRDDCPHAEAPPPDQGPEPGEHREKP